MARSVSPPYWYIGENGLRADTPPLLIAHEFATPAAATSPLSTKRPSEEPEVTHKAGGVASPGLSPVQKEKLQALNDEASKIRPRRTKNETLADAAVVFADIMTSMPESTSRATAIFRLFFRRTTP
jgi:hypothetical protein